MEIIKNIFQGYEFYVFDSMQFLRKIFKSWPVLNLMILGSII